MMGGEGIFLTMLAIFLGTMVSEDLACISAGILVAAGKLDYPSAVLASFLGIFVGDNLIYGMGRFFGRPVLNHRWARLVVHRRSVDRASHLFRRHGVWIIILTRFIPGTRSATYFAAGALHAPFLRFLLVFALAAALWTPFLVGLSWFIGNRLMEYYEVYEAFALPLLLAVILLLYVIFHYGVPAFTRRGRRRLKGKWMRATRWEFWPWWQVNWLVVLYVLYLGLFRYRRPTLIALVNPCMPHGGFLGESKGDILQAFSGAGEALPRWARIEGTDTADRIGAVKTAVKELGLTYPVVLKPDEGQRGLAVRIARNEEAALAWLDRVSGPAILQEYVPGPEYGVFYVRRPSEETGRIISVTIKEQLHVTGNGHDTLDTLIHDHPRAIALLDVFLDRFEGRLEAVPAEGERVPLGELGTHARGALFLDGRHLLTDALEARVDRIAKACPGFYFGRIDVKVPDEAALREGRGLRLLEVNGLTSEATHIYDPRHGLFHAWRTLCRQWRTAFEIGAEVAAGGAEPPRVRAFLGDFFKAVMRQRRIEDS